LIIGLRDGSLRARDFRLQGPAVQLSQHLTGGHMIALFHFHCRQQTGNARRHAALRCFQAAIGMKEALLVLLSPLLPEQNPTTDHSQHGYPHTQLRFHALLPNFSRINSTGIATRKLSAIPSTTHYRHHLRKPAT